MKNFNDVNELNRYLRNVLITQTGLNADRVLNALSIYGTELDKLLVDSKYDAITHTDTTLLFELSPKSSIGDVSMNEDNVITERLTCSNNIFCNGIVVSDALKVVDTDITAYKAFKLKLIIYGNSGSTLATKLVARLRTETVRTTLYEDGIYLSNVTDPVISNEFENETMWIRNDIDIDVAIQQKITQISPTADYEQFDDIQILN